MSFQNKSVWMPRNDEEINYNASSRTESKRDYPWFADASAPELFSSKKQAIDAVNGRPMSSGTSNARILNLIAKSNIPTIGASNLGDHQLGSGSSAGLSMSHTMEDPLSCLNYGGIIRKVNQARDAENGMAMSSKGGNNTIPIGAAINKTDNNNTSIGPTYNSLGKNTISLGPTFHKEDDKFISKGQGHSFNKGVGNFRLMGHDINMADDKRDDSSSISMDHMHEKGKANIISANPAYNKWQEKFIPMDSGCEKVSENSIPIGHSYDRRGKNVTQISDHEDKGKSSCLSVGQNCNNKGKSITISAGNFQTDQHNTAPNASVAPATSFTTDVAPVNEQQKPTTKTVSDNFPSNVKSLLSTGIFDGVPVKYFSWSREKNLKGIIKGTGFLCGCKDCKFSKAINAFEFERHAGCQTKHTNNHIYFQNGKTIYAVVQELKSYPPEVLLEAIPKATGSPINKKNFNIWKASYQAANHELQRIYAKDKLVNRS